MKQTKMLMGMTINIEIADPEAPPSVFEKAFDYFDCIDRKFSTYKDTSETSSINKGLIGESGYSADMITVLELAEQTKRQTKGYFNIRTPDGLLDPSGLVKGWAIRNAAKILEGDGIRNFYIDAGGDVQANGTDESGKAWKIGIRSPFNPERDIVKVVSLTNKGIATSGTYARGQHIYNPITGKSAAGDIISLSVIGPDVYEADRFATAAFAMEQDGIAFIESLDGLEGYMIDKNGIATMTSGFNDYVIHHA